MHALTRALARVLVGGGDAPGCRTITSDAPGCRTITSQAGRRAREPGPSAEVRLVEERMRVTCPALFEPDAPGCRNITSDAPGCRNITSRAPGLTRLVDAVGPGGAGEPESDGPRARNSMHDGRQGVGEQDVGALVLFVVDLVEFATGRCRYIYLYEYM